MNANETRGTVTGSASALRGRNASQAAAWAAARVATWAWLGALLVAGPGLAQDALEVKASGPKEFYADGRVGNNQMTFFSESTLEDFTGVSNQISGHFHLDPKKLTQFRGRFSIRVADISTGIELRDEHLRGPDWLDAAKHPEVVMEFARGEDFKRLSAESASLTLVGTCQVRGQTKDVRVPVTISYLDETPETLRRVKGDIVRLRSEFPLKLSDYGVHGPPGSDFIGLKVADTIKIKVSIYGSTEKPPETLKPDEPLPAGGRKPPPRPGESPRGEAPKPGAPKPDAPEPRPDEPRTQPPKIGGDAARP
jgi:polyisoprenoid-binding protein YceI